MIESGKMQLKKLVRYTKKAIQLGPKQSLKVLQTRVIINYKAKKLKKLALAKKAHHTWQIIAQKHKLNLSFVEFLPQLKQNCETFFPEEILQPLEQDIDIEKKADQFVQKKFDLLGSGPTKFGEINWHVDFRLKNQDKKADVSFCKTRFYQEPEFGESKTKQFAKDIKLPWELSRCYHFAVLGYAYKKTKNKKYSDAFFTQLDDWIEKNPYLLGPNWMCPMEVGIRAINWLVGFYYFEPKNKKYIESLYDHFIHLENNWEIYDSRTSNHYLSDLVGYFFLCFFFQNLPGVEKKKQWCYREILQEFDKQVFDEGTDYEGSTAYHGLVTELFYLFYALCKKNKQLLPERFEKKLGRMFQFLDWCCPYEESSQNIYPTVPFGSAQDKLTYFGIFYPSVRGEPCRTMQLTEKLPRQDFCFSNLDFFSHGSTELTTNGGVGYSSRRGFMCGLVKIGDDDSGKILFSGISKQLLKKFSPVLLTGTKQFPEFGLSIIKTKQWHITLRHHAYKKKQPSGHFHNDVGSITLAVNGVPILVDPGSFVYTASSVWRNRFRCAQAHNTFYLQGHEPVQFEDFLFTLDLSEKKAENFSKNFVLKTKHDLYKRFGLFARRVVLFNQEKNSVTVSDVWSGQPKKTGLVSCHNFTLAPNIKPVLQQDGVWMFLYNKKPILCLQTDDLQFQVVPGWFAPEYGKKVQTFCLRASYPVVPNKRVKIILTK